MGARSHDPLLVRLDQLRAAADHWQRIAECRQREIKNLRERLRELESAHLPPLGER